jgi:hypothetical protein
MQSPGSKSKRPRKNAEESSAALAQTPGAVGEETSKIRRKAIAPKTATEPTPAAKQHRGAAKKAPVAIVETAASASAPAAHADIATLAYSYWVQRGYQGGSAEEDWFRAEKQLLSRTIKP